MKPMDDIKNWLPKMYENNATDVLSIDEKNRWDCLTKEERNEMLKSLLEKPVDFNLPVYSWYFRTKWGEVLQAIQSPTPLSLLEIGSGSTDMLPQIMSRLYKHPETSYITVNMNKELTYWFRENTKGLPIKVDVVEDAAQNMENYFGAEKFDAIVFEHSFNDIMQAMLAERTGIDTIHSDWFEVLPKMINIINREYVSGTMEASVKSEFLELISSCIKVLKKGSYIIVNHFQYQYDLNLGMNPELWENLLNIIRNWINDAGLGQEVFFDGYEPQWWMFIKKV